MPTLSSEPENQLDNDKDLNTAVINAGSSELAEVIEFIATCAVEQADRPGLTYKWRANKRIKGLVMDIIGENEIEDSTRSDYYEAYARNNYRDELRKMVDTL